MILVTINAAVTVIPAGVTVTFIAPLILTYLVLTRFGSQKLEE
jgi:hypothetical protein